MNRDSDKNTHRKVLNLITAIRESHPDMVTLYTEGQCYNFYKILLSVFPSAECWYDHTSCHVYTKIGRYFYDIKGLHYKNNLVPLDHLSSDRPHRWGLRDRRFFLCQEQSEKELEKEICTHGLSQA